MGNGSLRWEDNHFVVLIHCFDALLALDDQIEWRVFQRFKSHFGFCYLRLNLAIFWLWAPLPYGKNRTHFAKLSEDKITFLVKALKLLAQSSSKSEGFNVDFEQKHVITGLHKLREIGDCTNVLLESNLRRTTDALAGTAFVVASSFASYSRDDGCGIFCSLRDFLLDKILVAQTLVIDPQVEKLVKVEIVFHEKSNVARFELHGGVAEYLRVGPDVGVKWA